MRLDGPLASRSVFEPTSPNSRIKGVAQEEAGPRGAPTARTVVWDTAAIPRGEPPASPACGQAAEPLAPLFGDANVICLVGLSISMQWVHSSALCLACRPRGTGPGRCVRHRGRFPNDSNHPSGLMASRHRLRESLSGREDPCFLYRRLSGYAHAVGTGRGGWVCGTPDRAQLSAP